MAKLLTICLALFIGLLILTVTANGASVYKKVGIPKFVIKINLTIVAADFHFMILRVVVLLVIQSVEIFGIYLM